MYEIADVTPYLLARSLIGPEAITDGRLTIQDASSRNSIFLVRTTNGPSYVIKRGRGPEGRRRSSMRRGSIGPSSLVTPWVVFCLS